MQRCQGNLENVTFGTENCWTKVLTIYNGETSDPSLKELRVEAGKKSSFYRYLSVKDNVFLTP